MAEKTARKRYQTLTTQEIKRLLEQYKAGVQVKALLKEFHICNKTLYNYTRAAGITRLKGRPSERQKQQKPPQKHPQETLCWSCQRAVPSPDDPTPCPWARRFEPVEGWEARENRESYMVCECPLYQRDKPRRRKARGNQGQRRAQSV